MGKVFLVGAGPGDCGLYTLKAKKLIQKADAIVYDYLANEVFLEWTKPECHIIYAGKKGGDHTLKQEEINELLVTLAKKYDVVVRLKGGDPYIFGRGGEEAAYLVDNHIEFEVVPGVTSAVAATAYAGIPLTHRDFSSSVTLVTGHESETKKESVLEWDKLARSASTLVFFMGVKNLPNITNNLIKAGLSPDMPAALIQWGTTCKQRSITSTLKNIYEDAKKNKISPPALLIVGDVVKLKPKLDWFEKRPLLGKNIVITRSRAQASDLVSMLSENGACVIQFPTIEIVPLEDYSHLYKEFERLHLYDWIIFTSVNSVEIFFKKLFEKGLDSRALYNTKICAIGPATANKIRHYSIIPDLVPPKYVAESIIEALGKDDIASKNILIPRALEARKILPDELKRLGAKVNVVPVYKTVLGSQDKDTVIEMIKNNMIDYVTFTSSSTVKNFFKLIPTDLIKHNPKIKFACIGPITANTLKEHGFDSHVIPENYTIPDLVQEIIKHSLTNKIGYL